MELSPMQVASLKLLMEVDASSINDPILNLNGNWHHIAINTTDPLNTLYETHDLTFKNLKKKLNHKLKLILNFNYTKGGVSMSFLEKYISCFALNFKNINEHILVGSIQLKEFFPAKTRWYQESSSLCLGELIISKNITLNIVLFESVPYNESNDDFIEIAIYSILNTTSFLYSLVKKNVIFIEGENYRKNLFKKFEFNGKGEYDEKYDNYR